ncbi:MAG TPA: glycosyl transferase family 2 [Candidatus Limnocylindria bacterium]|nr:glycosyl transferase family 2 [Candidatus Limnocylindria bacterium]
MAERTLLPDDLVRQLIAVGQVDVLVGLPTYNNAATVARVVKAVHVGFAKHFPRARTLLLTSDGGSEDGTSDVVRSAALDESETLIVRHALRTIHRVTTTYHGIPGKRSAVRTLFTAAELLQAKAVAILDPDLTSITPDWVGQLLLPIYREQYDLAVPIYARHRFEAPLVTQLVRPLFRGAYGYRVREPVGGEFACSGRFLSYALKQSCWDNDEARNGIELWLTASALAGGLQVCQTHLGTRATAGGKVRPTLPDLFQQVLGPLFASLEANQAIWTSRTQAEEVATFGQPANPEGEEPMIEIGPMADACCNGVRDLGGILETILSADTLGAIRAASTAANPGVDFPDALWAATVYEFAAAYHRTTMNREHLVQALVPLYLGRTASFVESHATHDRMAVEQQLEALGLQYEQSKPYLVERWTSEGGR